MGSHRLAITIERDLLRRIDRWVAEGRYLNRNQLIQAAVGEKVDRLRRWHLAEEAAKLDPKEERALAEEGL